MRKLICIVALVIASASNLFAADFTPDPASVQREGPAYRYPQSGWIVLHIEGAPYERGVQHGKLMWREIEGYVKAYAATQSPKAPTESWKLMRTMVDALFVRQFDPELLEEMKGVADGAAAAGAKFDNRPIDLTDVVAINAWAEIMCLDDALKALPNGLEGKDFDKALPPRVNGAPKVSRCSAFAATGPATADGKAVIGHITMFDIYPCNFFNVWIDVKPTKGHRVVIQGAPGSVQSGMDWYINDAGMVLTETTIGQTKYDLRGKSLGSRSRMAMQYADSIDGLVKILGSDNNGLYTNEWLIADMKTNEIAMYELGTATSRLMRSSKGEWFGGTEGFYWGCNNTKDLAVRMETIAAPNDRPTDMTFCCSDRDKAWVKLFDQYKGKIDENFGKLAFGEPPLAARNSCDAKYTTAALAMQMKSFAHWGDPYGQLWEPSQDERDKFPDVKPIAPNDWTVLTANAPAQSEAAQIADSKSDKDESSATDDDDHKPQPPMAWHGTILPASDADVWLTSAFAQFHEYAARHNELMKDKKSIDDLKQSERDELAVEMFKFRTSMFTSMPMLAHKIKLADFHPSMQDDRPTLYVQGRGALLLAELRRRMGVKKFDEAMDHFGRDHAGKAVATAEFQAAMQKASREDLSSFFDCWTAPNILPFFELVDVKSTKTEGSDDQPATYAVTGRLHVAGCGASAPGNIDLTLETDDGETTQTIDIPNESNPQPAFKFESKDRPLRVVINKYGLTPGED